MYEKRRKTKKRRKKKKKRKYLFLVHKEERGKKMFAHKKGKNREIKERVRCPNKKGEKGKKQLTEEKRKGKPTIFIVYSNTKRRTQNRKTIERIRRSKRNEETQWKGRVFSQTKKQHQHRYCHLTNQPWVLRKEKRRRFRKQGKGKRRAKKDTK